LGYKTIETRVHSRFAGLAGKRIAIHAGMKLDPDAFALAKLQVSDTVFAVCSQVKPIFGAIICTAFVNHVGWLDETHSVAAMINCKDTFRFGLFLTDIEVLKVPIPCKGKMGIFETEICESELIK